LNIFFLSVDAKLAAQYHVDRHAVKMITEAAQLLSTAHRVLDGDENGILPDTRQDILYKKTHVNHPCAKWVREAGVNYIWAYSLYCYLGEEYTHRYGKQHKSMNLKPFLSLPRSLELNFDTTINPPLAMPDEYKVGDAVESYREYYRKGKAHLHKWTNRERPDWL